MSAYQINLLLEALVRVYSSEELSGGEPIVSCLVSYLGFETEQAEEFVAGALQLKELRACLGDIRPRDIYVQ